MNESEPGDSGKFRGDFEFRLQIVGKCLLLP